MKKFAHLLLFALFFSISFTACKNSTTPESGENTTNTTPGEAPGLSGSAYMPDSTLDNYIFRIFNNANGRFVVAYKSNVTVDSGSTPPILTTTGQAGSYTNITSVTFKNTAGGTQMSGNNNNIGADTIRGITYVGPFDITNGRFYTKFGKLHYLTASKDSTITSISRVIYWNQASNGGGIAVGFLTQTDIAQ